MGDLLKGVQNKISAIGGIHFDAGDLRGWIAPMQTKQGPGKIRWKTIAENTFSKVSLRKLRQEKIILKTFAAEAGGNPKYPIFWGPTRHIASAKTTMRV